MKKDLINYTVEELAEYFTANQLPKFCAGQVFEWFYKKGISDFEKMTNISKETRNFLKEEFFFSQLKVLEKQCSADRTEKFLFDLGDGFKIESVLIPESSRLTLCISTQVGCKFNCGFCLSGKSGFKRNLSVSEIISQYLGVCALAPSKKITNIVFMGIGEPLDNFINVTGAIKIFMAPLGLAFGKRRICVSTSGLAPQIKELGRLKLGIKLSISLHSADNNMRTKLMPINKKYPLPQLMDAVKEFARYEKYPVTFEYALLSGINVNKEDALALAHLLRHINCKLNLIPYNRSSLAFKAPLADEIKNFSQTLKEKNIFFTLRKSRGEDINAACGQLRAHWLNEELETEQRGSSAKANPPHIISVAGGNKEKHIRLPEHQ